MPYFAARELRKLGVELRRIAVVPDEIPRSSPRSPIALRTSTSC